MKNILCPLLITIPLLSIQSFAADIEVANQLLETPSLTFPDSVNPKYYTDENTLIYLKQSQGENIYQFFSTSGSSSSPLTPSVPYQYPSSTPPLQLQKFLGNFSTSPNGKYSYYIYFEKGRTQSGSSPLITKIFRLNNGPTEGSILYDLKDYLDYYPRAEIAVNNKGTALVLLQRVTTNSVELPYEYALIYPDGTKKVLLYSASGGYYISFSINDLDTAFIVRSNGSIFSIDKNGTSKEQGSTEYMALSDRINLQATNVVTPSHPEGLLYFTSSLTKISNTEDGVIVDVSGKFRFVGRFSVNDSKRFVLSVLDFNGSSSIFDSTDLEKLPVISSGERINGNSIYQPDIVGINNSGDYAISYFSSASTNANLLVVEIAGNKVCDVAKIKGKDIKFFSQADPRWANEVYAFGAASTQSASQVTMRNLGCVTTSEAMLLDFYGLNQVPSGQEFNPSYVNKLFRSAKDINQKTVVTYTNFPVNKSEHNNVQYVRAAQAARTIHSNSCFSNSTTKTDQDKIRCIDESKSKISAKPDLGFNWQSTPTDLDPVKKARGLKAIEKEICAGNPVLLRVAKQVGTKLSGHTVLATATTFVNGKLSFVVQNPGIRLGSDIKMEKLSETYKFFQGFYIYRPAADPSMISIYSSSNVDFFITDQLGRRSGFDPTKNIRYDEIPKAQYANETILFNTDSDSEFADPALQAISPNQNALVLSEEVKDGQYQITTFGIRNGTAEFDISKTDTDGFENDKEYISFPITEGSKNFFTFNHSSKSLPILNSDLTIEHALYKNIADENEKVYFIGQINIPNNALKDSKFLNFRIGSFSDYAKTVELKDFTRKTSNKVFYYQLDNKSFSIILMENGKFWLRINDIDLNRINGAKWGDLTIGIDKNFGEAKVLLKCNRNICQGKSK